MADLTRKDVARILKVTNREQARTAEKVRRFMAECDTIDRIVDGAKGG